MRRLTIGVAFVAVAAIGARVVVADDPRDRKALVTSLVRGLEAADPGARAKAAAEIGTLFPEGAVAVPVLVDAAADDDSSVAKAAIVALRRLGNSGIEEIASELADLPAEAHVVIHHSSEVISALGGAITVTDLAYGLAWAGHDSPDVLRGYLLLLAASSAWTGMPSRGSEPGARFALLAMTAPFTGVRDPMVARCAAATLAVWGRSTVVRAPWDPATEPDLACPDAIVRFLSAKDTSTRWVAWGIAAAGAPHGEKTAPAMLAQWDAVKDRPSPTLDENAIRMRGGKEIPESAFGRGEGVKLLLALGARAGPVAAKAAAPMVKEDPASAVALLAASGLDAEAAAVWAEARADERTRREGGIDPRLVVAAARVPALRERAAKDLLPEFESSVHDEERVTEWLRTDEKDDTHRRATVEGWIATAILLLSAPEAAVPEASRSAAARLLAHALRRDSPYAGTAMRLVQTLEPGTISRVVPFLEPKAVHDLLTVPLRDGIEDKGLRTDMIFEFVATVARIPADAFESLERLLAAPTPDPDPSVEERAKYTFGWPFVREALTAMRHGLAYGAGARARLAAIDALGKIEGDPSKAMAALTPLLKDDDAQVRYRTARALRGLAASKK